MTAPVYQSSSSVGIQQTTSVAVPVPSGVAANDIIVVGLYIETTATVTAPSGFTQESSASTTASGQAHTGRLFWKRATGADSGTYSFSWTGSIFNNALAMRISGCTRAGDPFGTPLNTAVNNSGAGTTTPPPATLTPSTDDCMVVHLGTSFNGGVWVAPTGFTMRVETDDPASMSTLTQSTATATGGSVSATGGNSAVGRTGSVGFLLPAVQSVSSTSTATTTVTGDAGRVIGGAAGVTAATTTVVGNATIIPGTPPAAAAGVVTATTTVVGNAIRALGVSGTSAAVTTVTGTATNVRYAVSGTVTVTSATAGTVTAKMVASGTVTATTTVVGTVGKRFGPANGAAGTVTLVSGVTGAILVTGKPGQGSELLVLFNPDEVLTEGRVTYYQFDLLDEHENLVGTLQGVDSGDVTIDAYAAVKGIGKLTVYTDPAFSHLADGQPDFLGVQVNTPTGPDATAAGTPLTPDYLIASDPDAADISIGDQVILVDSGLNPKESTVFTVTNKVSAFGFTNIHYTPDSQALTVSGDMMLAVTVSFQQKVDWLNVRIRPMIRIQRLGGGDDPHGRLVPAGVFLCAAPVENWDATGLRRDVELVDKLSILDQDIASGDPTLITAYTALAGDNIITLVQALITETGETCPAIQPDTKTLAAPLFWDIGTTRLKIINDLLDAGGYFSLWCDGWGQYQATPYVQPSDRSPVYASIAPFSSGPDSLMDPVWTRDRNIYSIPNRYLVVGQGDGENPALSSLATNTDPDSPYSFSARGRWITEVEIGVEAVDQAALDTIARARLSSATSVTNQITLSHIFLPDLHINSVVHFVNPDSGLDIFCYVVQTTIPFDPTKLCSTTMRVVA